ncbi:MAG: aromatic ring-hydroxylating dioxygenase subunit alpha [Burkholderiales bacterium]|nr:aromatic ring-hydroxylating dioxygenase subunit alpha [Burkholderiales bacterium]
MFLRNAWYVAAWNHELGREPRAARILGDDIVLYRKADGTPAALEDACPHRKLPLSMGRIQGDHIECGYHGMTFDCSGRCVKVPGAGHIPSAAVVRSYPIVERYGLLWIWMGPAEHADPATIFAVEHWGDAAWGINQGDAMTIECNYLYITDNLLDPSHVSWVHQTSFGNAACEDTPLETTLADNGVTVWRWMNDVEPAPFYAPFLKFKGHCDRKQQYEVRYPSHALIKAIFTPAGSGGEGRPPHPDVFVMDSYNFMTPIDENNTRYYWFQMRNFAPGDAEVSRQFAESVRFAFSEDRVILQAVHKGIANERTPHIDLKIDVGQLRFRRRLAQLIEAERQPAAAVPA